MPVGQFFIALQVMYLLSTTLYNHKVSKFIAFTKTSSIIIPTVIVLVPTVILLTINIAI